MLARTTTRSVRPVRVKKKRAGGQAEARPALKLECTCRNYGSAANQQDAAPEVRNCIRSWNISVLTCPRLTVYQCSNIRLARERSENRPERQRPRDITDSSTDTSTYTKDSSSSVDIFSLASESRAFSARPLRRKGRSSRRW